MEKRLLAILRLALKYNATDIHITKRFNDISIEMRINDSLRIVKSKHDDIKLLRYLQYLANLDLGNLLIPQTGQFEMEVDGILLSLRFAIINTHNFTNGVLRILNSKLNIKADNLSNITKQNNYFKTLLNKDNGLIIFSGPTGSGKTTTIYSLLDTVKRKYRIYTIEDPIEIYNDEFIQLQVNYSIGFDYAKGIKQILRHDPDIIMIGEIRDKEAANMALQAANTGHLVLTTIHASSASSVISRMSELGVNENHLYEVLLSINNQRMMYDESKHQKCVLYETMDLDEINYYRKYHKHSDSFISLNKQIIDGINEGRFNEII